MTQSKFEELDFLCFKCETVSRRRQTSKQGLVTLFVVNISNPSDIKKLIHLDVVLIYTLTGRIVTSLNRFISHLEAYDYTKLLLLLLMRILSKIKFNTTIEQQYLQKSRPLSCFSAGSGYSWNSHFYQLVQREAAGNGDSEYSTPQPDCLFPSYPIHAI